MGERKVLNKYYPPDCDPSKIPRRQQPKNQQIKVRMMLPMSIQCATCGTYIYEGTKFNSRKEDVIREASDLTDKASQNGELKSAPSTQMIRSHSATGSLHAPQLNPIAADILRKEPEHETFSKITITAVADKEKRKRDAEEMGDAMEALENRAMDSKQDMDMLTALEQMRPMKSRHAGVFVDQVPEILRRSAHEKDFSSAISNFSGWLIAVVTCLGSENSLLTAKVVKHSRRDAIRVRDVSSSIDIAEVQQYVCNGAMVVFLKKWSDDKDPGPRSKHRYVRTSACVSCRYRIKSVNRFCSIGCKDETTRPLRAQDAALPKHPIKLEDGTKPICPLNKVAELPRTSRKGRPKRAPFY